MYGLDLFSGIGGLTKALEGYVEPVAYCENDRYAQAVLLSRMAQGTLPLAPIWDDVKTLRGSYLPGVDIIYGGFPCQDISVAGRGEGLGGEHSGLFFEIVRLCGEIRPRFIFLENVAAITVRGAERVVGEFCRLRYDCRWGILSAADVGANHRRERWWLLAHANGNDGRIQSESWRSSKTVVVNDGEKRKVADAEGPRLLSRRIKGGIQEKHSQSIERGYIQNPQCDGLEKPRDSRVSGGETNPATDAGWWATEPNVGRVAHGVPFRVDRLRALGNSVVPAQAREAFERLMGLKRDD